MGIKQARGGRPVGEKQSVCPSETILDHISDGFIALDAGGKCTYINHKGARLLRKDSRKLIGEPLWREFPAGAGRRFLKASRQAMSAQKPALIDDYYPSWKCWLEYHFYPSVDGLSIFFLDITGRKKEEDRLRRAERALLVLSASRQALFKAEDEAELLHLVCRHIVHAGGYRLAWIGLSTDDQRKTVRPVAQAGLDKGYLDRLNITWANTPRGRGPTGTAIRTGKPSIARNIQNDPRFKPWRKEALARGYASSLSLPLKLKEKKRGVLNVYAPEPNAFDAGEVKLLQTLADDLSFGINLLRDRLEHSRTVEALSLSEARYSDLYENATDMYLSVDAADGRIIQCNKTFERVTGYSRKEILGRPVFGLYHPDSQEDARKAFRSFISAGRVRNAKLQLKCKDDSKLDVILNVSAVRDERGRILYIRSILSDISNLVKMEEELREREAQLRLAVEAGRVGLFDWDIRSNSVYYSPEWKRQIGYEDDEISGDFSEWEKRVHPDDLPGVTATIQSYLKKPWPNYEAVFRLRHKNGSYRWILTHASVLRDSSGKPERMLGSHIDITERKRIEESLRKERDEKKKYLDIAGTAIIALDSQGRVTLVNRRGCSILGYKETEVLGESWFDNFIPERVRNDVKKVFKKLMRGKAPEVEDFVNSVLNRKGEERIIAWHNSILKDEGGRIIGTLSSGEDITERKRVEEEVRRRVEELTALNEIGRKISRTLSIEQVLSDSVEEILETIEPDVIFIFIRDGERLELKAFGPENMAKKFGKIPGHRVGECLCGLAAGTGRAIYSPDILSDDRCTWKECKRAGLHSFAALPLIIKGDVLGAVGLASVAKRDFSEQAHFLEILSIQISIGIQNAMLYEQIHAQASGLERRVAERTEELSEANIRLQELDRLKSLFIASMSHELRTPLNTIIGFSGILLKGLAGELNTEQKKQMGMVYSSARHLLALINDIIDLSKIEAGKIEIILQPVDMSRLIETTLAGFTAELEEKKLRLVEDYPEKWSFRTDEKRIRQVLTNLLSNAIKFTYEGSVEILGRIKKDGIEISIKDTGIGIASSDTHKLFKPFSQMETDCPRKQAGTGLGLYLSKKIVDLLGGGIWAESSPGRGSRFVFFLPNRPDKEELKHEKDTGGRGQRK